MRRLIAFTAVFLLLLSLQTSALAGPKKDGPGFAVSAFTSGPDLFPSVARMPDGRFVAVWTDDIPGGFGIKGRLLDAAGETIGAEFQVSTYTTGIGFPAWPDVAVDGDGDFVVAWGAADPNWAYGTIFARRYDSSGAPLDPTEFVVNSSSITFPYSEVAYLTRAAVASEQDGDFVVAWNRVYTGGSPVLAQQFDSTGSPAGGEVLASFTTTGIGLTPEVAMDSAGNFVVVWGEFDPPAGQYNGIFGRRFDSTGTALDPGPFRISAGTAGEGVFPSADARDDGDFVVVWHKILTSGPGPSKIRGRRFDSDGTPKKSEFQIAGFTTNSGTPQSFLEVLPDVSMDSDGDFVVVWDDLQGKDGDGSGIFGRRFKRNGDRLDKRPFRVNSYTTGDQEMPTVALEEDGGFLVVWRGNGAYGERIYDQKLRKPGTCGDYDMDGDGLGNACDIVVTMPTNSDLIDCNSTGRPTVKWRKGRYDKFRAMISWDWQYTPGMLVTSGKTLITKRSWTPTASQWNRVCNETFKRKLVTRDIYIRVFGVDTDVKKSNPLRENLSNEVSPSVFN